MAREKRLQKDADTVKIGDVLGLGGLLKGLGGLIELVSDMAEKGVETHEKVQEFQGKGPLKDVRGVFGVSVRMGLGEEGSAREVRFEPFGNISKTDDGVRIDEVREPLVDVFDEGDELLVVSELPGVREQDIQIDVRGDILQLHAERGARRYAKECLLPSPVNATDIRQSFNNGILEIRLRKTPDA